jgi:cytidyltransferase-like protein
MRAAVYAGTFDPITNGHLSIIDAAARLFDRLFVLIAVNPAKSTLFSEDERAELVREVIRGYANVSAATTHGLVVDFARAHVPATSSGACAARSIPSTRWPWPRSTRRWPPRSRPCSSSPPRRSPW